MNFVKLDLANEVWKWRWQHQKGNPRVEVGRWRRKHTNQKTICSRMKQGLNSPFFYNSTKSISTSFCLTCISK